MLEVEKIVGCLNSCVIDFFVGVPNSRLKRFCVYVTDICGEPHVIATNEGGVYNGDPYICDGV